MLAKTAGVEIKPYAKDSNKQFKPIEQGILNGLTIRDGEFLPGGERGFLNDRKWEREGGESPGSGINSSKRLPPYVTSIDVQIADHSIGLLNTCTFNILVQNPERDLEYIESIYCRPGRPVDVTIAYPESAVINGNVYLADEPMDSTKRIAALKQENAANTDTTADEPRPKQKLNETRFQGLVINFSIQYQTDLTCMVNVVVRGTSNVFTDVTAIMKAATDTVAETETTQTNNEINTSTLYDAIKRDFNTQIKKNEDAEKKAHKPTDDVPQGESYVVERILGKKKYYGLTGRLYEAKDEVEQYISLGWLIEFINLEIISKIENAVNVAPKIILDSDITKSGIDFSINQIVSSNPEEVILPAGFIVYKSVFDQRRESLTNTAGVSTSNTFSDDYILLQTLPQTEVDVTTSSATVTRTGTAAKTAEDCDNIMLNLKMLELKFTQLKDSTTGNVIVNKFLQSIFQRINYNTGGFIDLKLISHPDDPNALLVYNTKYKTALLKQKENGSIEPYSVPMFSNHPYGSVITDFKFNGELPKDSANLAFAINDIDDAADETIAPFLNFMYSRDNITRSLDNNIVRDTYDNTITTAYQNERYNTLKIQARRRLNQAKIAFSRDPKSPLKQQELNSALVNYIKYSEENFKDQYLVKSPVLPFTVEFTMNGINGLKWGDVLTFDSLPSRYKRNLVFSIIAVSHTVNETSEWTTNVKCVSRVKIDE
tara:strand:+ start:11 stop:2152 length:2142 start_codon:yes stop_codon:yes gene_type:complete